MTRALRLRSVRVWALGAFLLGAGAYASTTVLGARRAERWARAERVYVRECAYCHDVDENIGVALDARVLRSYGDAERLYRYVRLAMPYDRPRTLTEEEAWLSVAHLLRSKGLIAEDMAVDPGRAVDIVWPPRD